MNRLYPTPAILAILALQMACGCVLGNSAERAQQTHIRTASGDAQPTLRPAEVSVGSQDQMLAELARSAEFAEAWGVFSEGGWSNAGQVMVLLSADHKVTRALIVPPNKRQVGTDRALTTPELKALESVLGDIATLEDVDVPSFDGLVYEIVHAVRSNDGKATVQKRVLVRSADQKPTPKHDAVIGAFQKLRRP